MNYKDKVELAKNELLKSGLFNDNELQAIQNDTYFIVFSSEEYYQIFYLTNSELYYNEHIEAGLNTADLIEDTDNGRFFCFS